MGSSMSTQFLRAAEDRLLSSLSASGYDIGREGRVVPTNAFDERPIDVRSYLRSYASSCASRLAYVTLMGAAERARKVEERANAAAEAVKKVAAERASVAEYVAAAEALDDAKNTIVYRWNFDSSRVESAVDVEESFKVVQEKSKDDVRDAKALLDVGDENAKASKASKAYEEAVKKHAMDVCHTRVSLKDIWDAKMILGDSIDRTYKNVCRFVWPDANFENAPRPERTKFLRRFNPRSFLEELINQIAILEVDAMLVTIEKLSLFDLVLESAEASIRNHETLARINTFRAIVPHLRDVSCMDKALRTNAESSDKEYIELRKVVVVDGNF